MERRGAPAAWIAAGLVALYVLWGSTFLAIRIAVETVPPFLAAGARWCVAGGLLYAWFRPVGGTPARGWAWSAALALLLVVASNGAVTWAQTRVASGFAAVAIATVAPWLVVLEAVRPGGRRPSLATAAGVLIAVMGVASLVDRTAPVDPAAFAALLGAAFSFALGSTIARRLPADGAPVAESARQMLAGGAVLLGMAAASGESLRPADVSWASLAALAWLAAMGSAVGFTIYAWLVRVAPPALVGTYACVNPVIALALGAAVAGEALTGRMMVAAVLVVAGVAAITVGQTTSPLRPLVDWWTRRAYPGADGGADEDHVGARRLVARPGAAPAEAR